MVRIVCVYACVHMFGGDGVGGREGKEFVHCAFLCVIGYQQANVIILPDKLADDFEEFCQKNPVPLPLLYRSKSGQLSCPPLAECVDIR